MLLGRFMLSLRQSDTFSTYTTKHSLTTDGHTPTDITFRHWTDEFGEPLEEGIEDAEELEDEESFDSRIDWARRSDISSDDDSEFIY
jgi:hypothetical protein